MRLTCPHCSEEKESFSFYKNQSRKNGLSVLCKECFKVEAERLYQSQKVNSPKEFWCKRRVYSTKQRAKKIGLSWDLDYEYLLSLAGDRCPVLGFNLEYKDRTIKLKDNIPSVDRIDNSKGYIKGNISIISYRANKLKNNATSEELRCIADWMDHIS